MDRWQVAATTEEQYKVRDLDDAIRSIKRETEVPWSLKKSTMRVFRDVLVYPVATDHDHLAYLDTNLNQGGVTQSFNNRARFTYTSLQQFYENPNYRNDLAEIWEQGTKYLGIRYETESFNSTLVGDKTLADYTASADASALAEDTVVYLQGSYSIRFTNTVSSGTATVTEVPSLFEDTDYLRKYYFRWIYLTSVPTSITLRFGSDSSNYLLKSGITTQFSGQAFVANDWNLVAFDLNAPTSTTGTIDSSSLGYNLISLVGASAGYYYLDNSYLRDWVLLDYWYYSTYAIKTVNATVPDQEYFYNSSEVYATDSSLVGDAEWADVIMYDALLSTFTDNESDRVAKLIAEKRAVAWAKLLETYPSMKPLIVTTRLNFQTDYNSNGNWNNS